MHHLGRLAETAAVTDPYGTHSQGLSRRAIVDRAAGSVHQEIHVVELGAGGGIDRHLHAYEKAVYVLEGFGEANVGGARSEERRVGKECCRQCSSRGWP